jgi:hypothetical protein
MVDMEEFKHQSTFQITILQLVRSVKGNLKVGHSIRNPENMS